MVHHRPRMNCGLTRGRRRRLLPSTFFTSSAGKNHLTTPTTASNTTHTLATRMNDVHLFLGLIKNLSISDMIKEIEKTSDCYRIGLNKPESGKPNKDS